VAWVDADGTCRVQDTNSANGTWLDGQELAPGRQVKLTSGAMLRLAENHWAKIYIRGRDR